MTKVKLVNGIVLNAVSVELVNGVLKIATTDHTVEELAAMFADKSNTSLITLLTENEVESGFKTGFTSFAGITYGADGVKTVELYQPADVTEARLSNAEGAANAANATAGAANEKAAALEEQNAVLAATVDSILTEIIPSVMV